MKVTLILFVKLLIRIYRFYGVITDDVWSNSFQTVAKIEAIQEEVLPNLSKLIGSIMLSETRRSNTVYAKKLA